MSGLLDIGVDISVITPSQWPSRWPKMETITQLQGIGQTQNPEQSNFTREMEGHEGIFQSYLVVHYL